MSDGDRIGLDLVRHLIKRPHSHKQHRIPLASNDDPLCHTEVSELLPEFLIALNEPRQ
jgi:hypothetical protein